MTTYNIIILILSISFLGVSLLPKLLKNTMLSIPIIYVLFGIFLFQLPINIDLSDPKKFNEIIITLTEICVIISLMGVGLKIDKKLDLKNWKLTLIFLLGTMGLGIFFTTLVGIYFQLSLPLALLLASALSPTDPVLASDVQIGPPNEGQEDKVRFTLTTEAGLNDGLAFPFIMLSIALFSTTNLTEALTHWFVYNLFYKLFIGIFMGYACGKAFGYLLFGFSDKFKISNQEEGFIVIAMTLFSYGITEIMHGYGFLAVFITAIFIRSFEKTHKIHTIMHDFSDQTERMMLVTILIFFGAFISHGLLNYLTWQDMVYSLILIFIIRPFTGLITLAFTKMSLSEKFCISFFGVKGIGSFYYLSYSISKIDSLPIKKIWSIVGFIVLVSIFVHGISVTYVFNYLDSKKKRLSNLKQK